MIHISEREISLRNHHAAQIQVSVSQFPYIKTLEEIDYHFQPLVNKTEIRDLGTLRFLEHTELIDECLEKYHITNDDFYKMGD